jgi:hypothetical protein
MLPLIQPGVWGGERVEELGCLLPNIYFHTKPARRLREVIKIDFPQAADVRMQKFSVAYI